MKVAVLSDVHDNAHNLVIALNEVIDDHKVEKILFLGDFCGAAISVILKNSPVPVTAIWGNNDGDHHLITKFSLMEDSNMEVGFEVYDIVEIENRKIFLSHYPMLALPMARSGDFDAVFYGHNHEKHKEMVNDCLVINPGEIGAYKTGTCSYAVYDTKTNKGDIHIVQDSVTTNTPEAQKRFEEIKMKWNSLRGHQLGD